MSFFLFRLWYIEFSEVLEEQQLLAFVTAVS